MRQEVIFLVLSVAIRIEGFNNFADINCGKYNSHRLARVVGGREAEKGEFPWLVSLTRHGGHFCGGTIINNKFIMTAGHCLCPDVGAEFLKPSSVKITFSQHDLTKKDDTDAFQLSVKNISIHPGYICKKPKDDIAILELDTMLKWSESVLPACFPMEASGVGYTHFNNAAATVAGWGWTNENQALGGRAKTLQKANVNVIDLAKCQSWYKSQGKKTKLQGGQMCAGYEKGGIDACWADSGGPLMINVKGEKKMMVVGVVSTGIGCARPYLPGIYTRVSEYIPWIQNIIKK